MQEVPCVKLSTKGGAIKLQFEGRFDKSKVSFNIWIVGGDGSKAQKAMEEAGQSDREGA